MKKTLHYIGAILTLFIPVVSFAQMNTIGINGDNIINFESFTAGNQIQVSEELLTLTNSTGYAHPEFGINPFNTPCEDCIELVDRRTENTRYFVKKATGGSYFFKQTSSMDLHYKNNKNQFLTIDARLKPTENAGVFSALTQNNPTTLNLIEGFSELNFGENRSVKFNRNSTLFSSNTADGIAVDIPQAATHTNYSVGDDGGLILNTWNGINTEMIYSEGAIKTNFVLNNLNAINTTNTYTVIEDVLALPANMQIIYDQFEGAFNVNGIWEGDLLLVDQYQIEYVRFSRPIVYDSDTSGINEKPGFKSGYKIIATDGVYRIQLFVSNNYLKNENRTFPIIIDPLVFITTNWTGTSGSNFSPAFCSLVTNVATPANATLTNATMYWEVVGSFLGDCGAPPASRCYLNKAQIYFSTSCGTSPVGAGTVWICAGVCSGYGTWGPTTSTPTLVTCLTPACASYNIPFTAFLNRTACAGGTCATACIRLTRFNVTIEGRTLEGSALTGGIDLAAYTIVDCATQTVTFTGSPLYGVGPFTYAWTPSGGTGASDTYLFPLGTTVVTLTITDACGNILTDNVTVTNPCPTPLPISLLSFNGYHVEKGNYLHWSTASEENSKSFIIERSFDGNSFEAIGTLEGAGNSNAQIAYNYLDEQPGKEINYYRLKMLDLDGDFAYSSVIAIRSESILVNSFVLNSSNPNTGELNLSVVSATAGEGVFKIIDIIGRKVYQKSIYLNSGINAIMLYPELISAGTYILQFSKNDQFETIKFEMH